MTPHEESIEREDWLAHAAALRRLATSLLRDEHEAEDLVQETWLRARASDAMKTPPWYRTVLRNLARDRMRGRGRREGTEREAARGERVPSESEIAERLETAQRLAAEVARLEDPFRTAIHLRYFEDRSPEEIARMTAVPVETARTRLRRGLEKLRERMDRAHEGRRESWALLLLPLARQTGVIVSAKIVVSTVAAAVVITGGWFVLRQHSAQLEPAAQQPVREAELHKRLEAAVASTREAMPTPVASDKAVEVHGTIVVEDQGGVEHARESGKLSIAHYTTEQNAIFVQLDVVDGAWSTKIPPGELFVVLDLVAGNRAVLLPKLRPLAPGPDTVVVRGKWLSRGWLRVVDAETKQELGEIEVRYKEFSRGGPLWTHPGDDVQMKIAASNAVSPVSLPDRKAYTHYWVHAPGHAWTRIDFDHRAGGERIVELAPNPCSIVVNITGGLLPDKACVRLYPRSGTVREQGIEMQLPAHPQHWCAFVSVSASTDGPTRIDELAAGEFFATVEVGEDEETLRIGESPVDVEPGGSSAVTVSIDPSVLAVPRTHLHGILEVPEGLDRGACKLRLRRVDGGEKDHVESLNEMSFGRGDQNRLHWDAGLLRTGDYDVKVHPIEYGALIHAPGPGETEVKLTIPPLVKVRVDVVDAESGAKIDPERIQWEGPRPEGAKEFELVPLFRDPRTGFFDFVAPRGDVQVYCRHPGYKDAEQKLALLGPDFSVTIALERSR